MFVDWQGVIMVFIRRIFLAVVASFGVGHVAAVAEPATVPFVDVERYMGTWYEIASFPKGFQFGCTATQADYSLLENGRVQVENSCRLFYPTGFKYGVKGEARVVNPDTNAQLKVKFFWAEGDYWVLDLADDYSYALVGSPDLDSLWILSRTRSLDGSVVEQLTQKAESLGFDTSRLKMTKQPTE
jgi:apolipoprotein D and lipocalin family protein